MAAVTYKMAQPVSESRGESSLSEKTDTEVLKRGVQPRLDTSLVHAFTTENLGWALKVNI